MARPCPNQGRALTIQETMTATAPTSQPLPEITGADTGADPLVITAPAGYSSMNLTAVSVGGMLMTASCVLSPSSATKTVAKTVNNILRSTLFSS